MAVNRIYAGTVGLALRITLVENGVVYDPADADSLELTIIRPDKSVLVVTSPDVGVDTDSRQRPCLLYVLDEALEDGPYRLQPYVTDSAGSWAAEPVNFSVLPSIR